MADKSHLEVQATAWRELAERARRLAGGLLDGPDRDRLLAYSAELVQKAEGLEAELRSDEQQQQHVPELASKPSDPEPKG